MKFTLCFAILLAAHAVSAAADAGATRDGDYRCRASRQAAGMHLTRAKHFTNEGAEREFLTVLFTRGTLFRVEDYVQLHGKITCDADAACSFSGVVWTHTITPDDVDLGVHIDRRFEIRGTGQERVNLLGGESLLIRCTQH